MARPRAYTVPFIDRKSGKTSSRIESHFSFVVAPDGIYLRVSKDIKCVFSPLDLCSSSSSSSFSSLDV